jgi:hypothetical protein
MKFSALAPLAVLALAPAAMAQDGAYYGIGLGVSHNTTSSPVISNYDATATDVALALTAGYRFATAGNLTYGIEGNLDIMSGNLMSDSIDACTDWSPTWCEVDAALRLRGTMASDLGGSRLTASLGAVVVRGLAENGPGNYVDTTGRGLSVGVAWEKLDGSLPVRVDLNYDAIRHDNQTEYDRSLDMVGLRVSYMF